MGITKTLTALPERAKAHHAAMGRPYVILSYAQTLDGALSAQPGHQTLISGPESLVWTHRLRAACDAILVGIGTALADDPQLTVRHVEGGHPQPIVLDSQLRLPPDARLFMHPTHQVWVAALTEKPTQAHILPSRATAEGHIELESLLEVLGKRGITSIMVEGGIHVLASFMRQGLANSAMLTIAPRWFGPDAVRLMPGTAADLHTIQMMPAGDDILLWGEF